MYQCGEHRLHTRLTSRVELPPPSRKLWEWRWWKLYVVTGHTLKATMKACKIDKSKSTTEQYEIDTYWCVECYRIKYYLFQAQSSRVRAAPLKVRIMWDSSVVARVVVWLIARAVPTHRLLFPRSSPHCAGRSNTLATLQHLICKPK